MHHLFSLLFRSRRPISPDNSGTVAAGLGVISNPALVVNRLASPKHYPALCASESESTGLIIYTEAMSTWPYML
jgi:hypothetical protein